MSNSERAESVWSNEVECISPSVLSIVMIKLTEDRPSQMCFIVIFNGTDPMKLARKKMNNHSFLGKHSGHATSLTLKQKIADIAYAFSTFTSTFAHHELKCNCQISHTSEEASIDPAHPRRPPSIRHIRTGVRHATHWTYLFLEAYLTFPPSIATQSVSYEWLGIQQKGSIFTPTACM